MLTNQYKVTKERYMSWFKMSQKTGIQLKITIMWSVILLILLAAAGVVLVHPMIGDPLPWISLEGVFILFACYHLFFRRRLMASRMYDMMAQRFGKDWERTIDFQNDKIVIVEGAFEVKYPYREISSVRSKGDLILIETEKKLVIHAYKDTFIEGDYPKFRRFIESRVVNRCWLS